MTDKAQILICEYFRKEVEAVITSEGYDNVTVKHFPARCGFPRAQWPELSHEKQALFARWLYRRLRGLLQRRPEADIAGT